MLLFSPLVGAAAPESPYPPSAVIEGIEWDFAHAIRLAPGSDLWPVTWGGDGGIYAAFGDGGGFGGTNEDGRASLGFARISGMPPGLRATNVWGGKNAENPAQFGGKVGAILSVDGVLYAIGGVWRGEKSLTTWNSPHESRLLFSRDGGARWQIADWTFAENESADFGPRSFLNFGRDYAGARDDFVYLYFSSAWWTWKKGASLAPTETFLARVPKNKILERDAYEFFHGNAEKPRWTRDIGNRSSIFTDPNHRGISKVVYDAPLKRYLATVVGAEAGQFALCDAPEPWGPWTTILYENNWNHLGAHEALSYDLPTKWISADGTEIWCVFSSTGQWDSFNLVKGTLKRRTK